MNAHAPCIKKRTILIHTDVNHTTKCSQRPAASFIDYYKLCLECFSQSTLSHAPWGFRGLMATQDNTTQPHEALLFQSKHTHSHARPNRWYVCLNRDAHVSTYHGAHKHTEFGRDAGSIRRQYLFILENNQSKTWAANDRRKQCQPVSPLITSLIPHTKSMHQVKIHK